jgi:hypothetical protein
MERPITVTLGTNVLVGQDLGQVKIELAKILAERGKQGRRPPLGMGMLRNGSLRFYAAVELYHLPRQVDFAASEG